MMAHGIGERPRLWGSSDVWQLKAGTRSSTMRLDQGPIVQADDDLGVEGPGRHIVDAVWVVTRQAQLGGGGVEVRAGMGKHGDFVGGEVRAQDAAPLVPRCRTRIPSCFTLPGL